MLYFFFNDTATTEIYTLSLHDALPISLRLEPLRTLKDEGKPDGDERIRRRDGRTHARSAREAQLDRKSTRLNSSHANISYAVFCLKKKHTTTTSSILKHQLHTCKSCSQ